MTATAAPTAATAAPEKLTVDRLVDATPASRERYADFLRALSIAVVVAWHWVFSLTHWRDDGSLTMPNPIDDIPLLWAATWVLQIMPVFFIVGGFADAAGFEALERRGATTGAFVRGRLERLLKPVAWYVAVWATADLAGLLLFDGYRSVLHWGFVVFVPLWFLGVYLFVTLLTPLTIAAHRRAPWLALGGLGLLVGAADVGRLALGVDALGVVTTAGVWHFAHQLGYSWRDGRLLAAGRWVPVALAAAGFAGLVLLTSTGSYSHSMVAVQRESMSNMNPTSAVIAVLAVFQLGLVLLLRDPMSRWLERRRPWKVVVSVNAVAMSVFSWHMTALVGALGIYQLVGVDLGTEPTLGWWLQRPLFVVLPGAFLAGLIALFARFELPRAAVRR
jgi:hypothetical protein